VHVVVLTFATVKDWPSLVPCGKLWSMGNKNTPKREKKKPAKNK
jgi:hypothetical protein